MEVCKVVGKKRFAASEKRKAIRWLGARCVTGSEQDHRMITTEGSLLRVQLAADRSPGNSGP